MDSKSEFFPYYNQVMNNKNGCPIYLRDIQLICVLILKEIIRVCELNNLQYFLEAGTILGCIRHNGFIAWDDDLDIGIRREDYLKFLDAMNKDLNKDKFICSCLETNPRHKVTGPAFKIRIKNTYAPEKYNFFVNKSRLNEIFVDINVFDNAGIDNVVLDKYRKKSINMAIRIEILQFLGFKCVNLKKKFIKNSEEYGDLNKDSEYVSNRITWIATKTYIYKKSDFFPLITHSFEGIDALVPIHFEEILVSHFNNWRKYPDEKKRCLKHLNTKRIRISPSILAEARNLETIEELKRIK